jgi:hypothetical protein
MRKFSFGLLVILMFLGLTNISFCQLQVLRDQGTGNPVMANPYPEVKGSPYWSEFEIGKIIFSENSYFIHSTFNSSFKNPSSILRAKNNMICKVINTF